MYLLFLYLIGASIWSFVYTASIRYTQGKNFISGRSQCPNCGNTLKPFHLIPVIGYLILKGKCAFCKSRISLKYFAAETFGGIIIIVSVLKVFKDASDVIDPLKILTAISFFLLLTVLLAISVIDGITMEIPDTCIFLTLILSLLSSNVYDLTLTERIAGFFTSSSVYLVISLLVKDAFGFGDVKLSAVLGILFGWKLSLVSLFFSILSGGAYGIFLIVSSKKRTNEHFAFAPFISISVIITLFIGEPIVSWYESMILNLLSFI